MIIFEICWLSIFKRANLEVQAYYRVQLTRAMVGNTTALWWWHCYGITVNDQNIKELIEVQSSIKVNWFFWQRMQMCSFDTVWIPTNYRGLAHAHFYGYQFMNSCVSHGERKRGVAIINIPFYWLLAEVVTIILIARLLFSVASSFLYVVSIIVAVEPRLISTEKVEEGMNSS